MGRDRDPFDRALETLRARLTNGGPLQGEALPVNVLAAELGVSPTPVREALSRLAGEGLVARTSAGYTGLIHDAASLAELYGLTGLLALALLREVDPPPPPDMGVPAMLVDLAARADNRVLATEVMRFKAQLAPFAEAERRCLSADPPAAAGSLSQTVRRYYARRVRRSSAILGAAIAARIAPRI